LLALETVSAGKKPYGVAMEVQVKIINPCVFAEFGQLRSGDIVRTSKASANLLVNDYKVAVFDIPKPTKPVKK
jgi:hypothetical protein